MGTRSAGIQLAKAVYIQIPGEYRTEISGAVRAKSITAFTSYDTLKGRRILRVGGDWGHKRTRMIKIWTVGQVTAAEPGSAFGDPH